MKSKSAPNSRNAQAFTLVELVISLGIMSFLLVGLASSILIAGQAMPTRDDPDVAVVRAAEVAAQITEELRSALWITVHNSHRIKFTIPDRDGDGVHELIVYRWSGTSGDPLERNYNRGGPVAIIDSVRELNFEYMIESVAEEYPGPPVESSEIMLSLYDGSNDLRYYEVDSNDWVGQYFQPVLDGSAVSWKVTRAFLEMRRHGSSTGEARIQLRHADKDDLPVDDVIDEQPLYESDLDYNYSWRQFVFSNAGGLTPGDGLCLVVKHISNAPSCDVQYENVNGQDSFYSSNAGSSWNMYNDNELRHGVMGTWSAPGDPQTAVRQYVTGVRVAITPGFQSAERVVASAQTLNCPELLSAVWEADFSGDPTVDLNGDGEPDWAIRGGDSFNTGDLSDGVWKYMNLELDTTPDCTFTKLTTVETRFRSVSVGSSAVLWCNVDFDDGNFMPIVSHIVKNADQSQTLTVVAGWSPTLTAASITGLSADFVNLRLLIDPTRNTVNVKVNGRDYGTTLYVPYSPGADPQSATLTSWNGGFVEVDSISIRVSE